MKVVQEKKKKKERKNRFQKKGKVPKKQGEEI